MLSKQSEAVELVLDLIHETPKAYLISTGKSLGKGRFEEIWLPKSLVEKDGKRFTMPEWLAFKNGLI